MQSKILFTLFSITVLFIVSCGNSTSDHKPAIATAAAPPGCAPQAQAVNRILFGDHHGDTIAAAHAQLPGGGCINQGICEPSSVDPTAINVTFNYTQGVGGNPSGLTVVFPYATLLQNQQAAALLFYNNQPIPNYQFLHAFALSTLGGTFANVCGTINPTPAGAGVITYNPPVAAPFPPNAQMTSTVTVTFTLNP